MKKIKLHCQSVFFDKIDRKSVLFGGGEEVGWVQHWALPSVRIKFIGRMTEDQDTILKLLKTKRRPLYLKTQSVPRS